MQSQGASASEPQSAPALSEQTKGEAEGARHRKEAAEMQADLVQRANTLFRRLGINARPIQSFEDLQRTASSMFVGIFEKMFNVDLKHAVRKPNMVAHYIKNAKIVIHALSEASDLDLSHLSAEEVYRGEPTHIDTLITIFETYWDQLNEEFTLELERQVAADVEVAAHSGDNTGSSPKRRKKRKGAGKSKRKSISQSSRVVHKVDPAKENKRKQLKEISERYTFRYPASKKAAAKKKRKRKAKTQKKTTKNTQGLANLAERHPRLFQTLSLRKGKLLKSTLKRPRAKGPQSDRSALVNRLEADVVKYQKAYELLLKQRLSELRRETLSEINVGQLKRAGAEKLSKIEHIEAERLQEDLNRTKRSEKMRSAAQEEVQLRRLLGESMKHEHRALLDQRRATLDAQKRTDQEQLNRYESLQRFLSDQQQLLHEQLQEQQDANRKDSRQQQVTLANMARDLRAQFRQKMKSIESDWQEQGAQQRLHEQEQIESIFEELDQFVSTAAAKSIRATLTKET